MRIAVIGAGIIGVTTAHELAADGHQVEVFERKHAVASEGSFANGGALGAGWVFPGAVPGSVLEWLVTLVTPGRARQLGWRALGSPAWLARHLWAGRRDLPASQLLPLQRLAHYSRQRLDQWTDKAGLSFERAQGCLVALRPGRELARWRRHAAALEAAGIRCELLDAHGARVVEPALADSAPLHAALYLPTDGVGNCRQFAHAAKAAGQALGVGYRFGVAVCAAAPGKPCQLRWHPVDQPEATAQTASFDAVVLCAGTDPAQLLGRAGVTLPLLAVQGYSLTAPIRQLDGMPDNGPRAGLYDARHGVWITRLGQRLRVSGVAEIGTPVDAVRERALAMLYRVLDDWYPGAADITRFSHWKGARPTLADGLPVIGPAGPEGLWLNLGHGAQGWSLACGSARLLADQLGVRSPEIDPADWQMSRLGHRRALPSGPVPATATP